MIKKTALGQRAAGVGWLIKIEVYGELY